MDLYFSAWGQWAEVRTLAIGEVKEEAPVQIGRMGKTEQVTYFSRMTDAETFGESGQSGVCRH